MINSAKKIFRKELGVASVLVPMFIIAAVVFLLGQALVIGGNRSLDDVNQIDSAAAFHLAETGLENATARLVGQGEPDATLVSSVCSLLPSEPAVTLGRGTYVFEAAQGAGTVCTRGCTVRVRGEVRRTKRVIERTTCVGEAQGNTGFAGSDLRPISSGIKNSLGIAGFAVFNLAWRIQGSDGFSTTGGASSASCLNCIESDPLWTLQSNTGGTSSAGSMGAAISIPANGTVMIQQKVTAKDKGKDVRVDRNYVQVGIVLPSLTTNTIGKVGTYSKYGTSGSDITSNNSADQETFGGVPHWSQNNNWCADADTLAMGITGSVTANGRDAQFASITFDTDTQKKVLGSETGYKARFPASDTPEAAGDLVSEIYILHNPLTPVLIASGTSVGNIITVGSTDKLIPGTILRVMSGAGLLQPMTKVVEILSPTQLRVDLLPTTPIAKDAKICGGICAFFNPSVSAYTRFAVKIDTSTQGKITQWAAGFACFKNVDGTKIRPVLSARAISKNWREVIQ